MTFTVKSITVNNMHISIEKDPFAMGYKVLKGTIYNDGMMYDCKTLVYPSLDKAKACFNRFKRQANKAF